MDRLYDFNDPDVIIVFGGSNDTFKDVPLGEYNWDAPLETMELTQFRSAYVYMVRRLHEIYRGVQLVLVIGDRLTSGYETSILDIAEHFDLPCVNFVSDPISRIDSTHPDAKGHEQIARKIYDSCKDCLKSASDSELPPVTVPEGELPQEMTISLQFYGEDAVWPFEEPAVSVYKQRAGGEKYTYSYAYMHEGKEMKVELPFVISRGRFRRSENEQSSGKPGASYEYKSFSNIEHNVLWFSDPTSWIRVPYIEGRRLKSVSVTHGNMYDRQFRLQSDVSPDPEWYLDSDPKIAVSYTEPVEMKVENTHDGEAYVVRFISTGNIRIFNMTLVYEKETVAPAAGCRVGIMGDSISTFKDMLCDPEYRYWYPKTENDPNLGVAGREEYAVDTKEKTWWGKLIYEYMDNAVLDANSSFGGSKVISQPRTSDIDEDKTKMWDAGMADRVYDFINPDIIFIHGGTNDSTIGTDPLGSFNWSFPIRDLDVFSFRSAYDSMVRKMLDYYNGVKLVLIVGPSLTKAYEEAIITVADHYNLRYVNFVGDQIDMCNGVHPSAVGHKQMADKIYAACKDMM